eukprot:COSAG06_NODE_7051_length_2656_cov_9.105626_2_plen_63_part_01
MRKWLKRRFPHHNWFQESDYIAEETWVGEVQYVAKLGSDLAISNQNAARAERTTHHVFERKLA